MQLSSFLHVAEGLWITTHGTVVTGLLDNFYLKRIRSQTKMHISVSYHIIGQQYNRHKQIIRYICIENLLHRDRAGTLPFLVANPLPIVKTYSFACHAHLMLTALVVACLSPFRFSTPILLHHGLQYGRNCEVHRWPVPS
jgi:hypothetical protein